MRGLAHRPPLAPLAAVRARCCRCLSDLRLAAAVVILAIVAGGQHRPVPRPVRLEREGGEQDMGWPARPVVQVLLAVPGGGRHHGELRLRLPRGVPPSPSVKRQTRVVLALRRPLEDRACLLLVLLLVPLLVVVVVLRRRWECRQREVHQPIWAWTRRWHAPPVAVQAPSPPRKQGIVCPLYLVLLRGVPPLARVRRGEAQAKPRLRLRRSALPPPAGLQQQQQQPVGEKSQRLRTGRPLPYSRSSSSSSRR